MNPETKFSPEQPKAFSKVETAAVNVATTARKVVSNPRFQLAAALGLAEVLTTSPNVAEAAGPCTVDVKVYAYVSDTLDPSRLPPRNNRRPSNGQPVQVTVANGSSTQSLITDENGTGINTVTRDNFARLRGESRTVRDNNGRTFEVIDVNLLHPNQPLIPIAAKCEETSNVHYPVVNPVSPRRLPDVNARNNSNDLLAVLHEQPILREIGDFWDQAGTWIERRMDSVYRSHPAATWAGDRMRDLGSTVAEFPPAKWLGDHNYIIGTWLFFRLLGPILPFIGWVNRGLARGMRRIGLPNGFVRFVTGV